MKSFAQINYCKKCNLLKTILRKIREVLVSKDYFYMIYEEFGKIYVEIYLGYSNKEEEKVTRILTKNIVFFQENLYRFLSSNSSNFRNLMLLLTSVFRPENFLICLG